MVIRLIQNVVAVEYNAWMSLISFVTSRLTSIASTYGLSGVTINVLSSYPKDLTKFSKPSIIIQKIHTDVHPIGFGSVLGEYFDVDTNTVHDVSGQTHVTTFQVNVIGDTNTISQLITSAMVEDVLCRSSHRENEVKMELYNYITDPSTPDEVGVMDIVDKLDVMYMESNENKDYYSAIRVEVGVIQHRVIVSDVVDLSKELKFVQTIKL